MQTTVGNILVVRPEIALVAQKIILSAWHSVVIDCVLFVYVTVHNQCCHIHAAK